MKEFLLDTLKSRAFWTSLGPLIVAIFNLIGRPLGDDQIQAITVILSAIAGWFAVTAARAARGGPTSFRKMKKEAEDIADDQKYGVYTP